MTAAADFRLDAGDLVGMTARLRALGWLQSSETILDASRAGEGNMNYTLRIRTTGRTVILKQSRPWVEKYPHIPAPRDRALVEAAFYSAIGQHPLLACSMPRLLGVDAEARMLLLEDVAPARDFAFMYGGELPCSGELRQLVGFLAQLNGAFSGTALDSRFENQDMRRLNHEHIFAFPLRTGNGLDLDRITPGLAELAARLVADVEYCGRVTALGERYLRRGNTLVHGDYFPGSWLRSESGIKVIDPEFCFAGDAEFDVGVMIAHLHLASAGGAMIAETLRLYTAEQPLDLQLTRQFAGVEIMRRLYRSGATPLPLRAG